MKNIILKDKVSDDVSKPRALGHFTYPNSESPHQSNTFYDTNAVSPTLDTCSGGNTQVKILVESDGDIKKVDIPQAVKVRKYPVDCEKLAECLREHKTLLRWSNKQIAEYLRCPITEVEHWFRNDKYFSIPNPKIWFELKDLLDIETDEFDESIMTFEERESVFEKSERHHFVDGVAPTLTSSSGNEKIIVSEQDDRIIEPINTEIDGTARTTKAQYFENGVANLTNDNSKGGKYACTGATNGYRIRKLTPRECWRLMGFDDADFDKVVKVCSNTQLYKQAGNSIVVNVLEGILGNLLPKQSRSEWLDELLAGD